MQHQGKPEEAHEALRGELAAAIQLPAERLMLQAMFAVGHQYVGGGHKIQELCMVQTASIILSN